MTKRKTVRVRIAVAVDAKGKWSGFGWSTAREDELLADVLNTDDLGAVRHSFIITADVPLPPSPTIIKGKVTAAKGGKK